MNWLQKIVTDKLIYCSFCKDKKAVVYRMSPVFKFPKRAMCKPCAIRDLGKKCYLSEMKE